MKPAPKRILVVVAQPGEHAYGLSVDGSLEALQTLVGGGYLEALAGDLAGLEDDLHLYVNENGKARAMAHNLALATPYAPDFVCGPIVVSKADDEGDEVGLSPDEAERARLRLDSVRGLGRV